MSIKPAVSPIGQHLVQIGHDSSGRVPVQRVRGGLIRMEIIQQESRVVIVHLLKVRDSPLRVSGVPEESSADLVIDAAMGHRIQTRDRDLQHGRVLLHKMPGQGELDRA